MKKILTLIVLSVISQFALAQNTYFKTISSSLVNGAGSTCETNNGNIIMYASAAADSFLQKKYILFLKINNLGDTIASRKFMLPEDYYDFSKIIEVGDNLYTAVGSSFNLLPEPMFSVNNSIIYYTFNSNLDSVAFKKITQAEDTISLLSMRDAIKNNNNNIVTLCEDMSHYNIMLMEASASGDSIRSSQLLPTYATGIYSISQKKDLSGYLVTCEGGFNQLPWRISHILTLDNNLDFVSVDSLPGECAYFSQIGQLNIDILVGGRALRYWGGIPPPIPPPDRFKTEEYCIERLNTSFNVVKQVFLSHVVLNHHGSTDDTLSVPAGDQNFSFVDTNNIYTCHFRMLPWQLYPDSPNYFVVANFNNQLDLKWQYYFGNDAYYTITRILATTDGGCFVNGGRYDYTNQNQEYDVFYMKLDSTGIFTSSDDTKIEIHSALVFPNPGKDILYLESGPQVIGSNFQLFSLNGIKMHEERIKSNQQQINTSNFRSGVYIWRIISNGKVVDSGKWIKLK